MCMNPEPRTPNKGKKVTILGLGGSGGKIVHHIAEQTDEYNLIYVDSDEKSLLESTVKTIKNTDKGQTDYFSIIKEIKNNQRLIITTGLGGKFGTFNSYIIYKMAKTENIPKIELFLTMPAKFEGKNRINKATEALNLFNSDNIRYSLIEFDKLIDKLVQKISLNDCYRIVDKIMYQEIMRVITN